MKMHFILAIGFALVFVSCGHPKEHHSMPHNFSDVERWSQVFDSPERDQEQMPDHVIELMKIEPGMTVADLGAGTGYFLPYLSKAVGGSGKVWALDIEKELVHHMNERAKNENLANVEAMLIPTDDPSLQAKSVDRILIVNTWHHIPHRVEYAKKLAASLKTGGKLFIVDLTMESKVGPHKNHRLPPEKVIETLEAAGFTATIETENLPNQFVVSATF